MKYLIINGSHRVGNTTILCEKLKGEICLKDSKNSVDILVLRDLDMKLPDGCAVCADGGVCPNLKDNFSENIEPTLRDYDVYIIATPTYDDGITPLTKIFWDRIVSWSHDDRKYLKDKKLAIVTHGMAGHHSWEHPINWVKSVCFWEKSVFAGSLTFSSGAEVGTIEIDDEKLKEFTNNL